MAATEKDRLIVEKRDRVTVLTLNRPEAHNCIDAATAERLGAAIEDFAGDVDSRVMVVTGAGGTFCSGADLRNLGGLLGHPYAAKAGPLGFARLDPGKPTIAAVEGYCVAGGLELAAWCDFRIASENAAFGGLNRRWGVPFVDGGTQRLPRIVGLSNALWLILSGVLIDASRAQRIGLVQEVMGAGGALGRALEVAAHIAVYPQESLTADRRSVLGGFGLPLSEGLDLERRLGGAVVESEDSREALRMFEEGTRPEPLRPSGD